MVEALALMGLQEGPQAPIVQGPKISVHGPGQRRQEVEEEAEEVKEYEESEEEKVKKMDG